MTADGVHSDLRACPVCDATAATRIDGYSPEPWIVAACDACGFVYLRNPPAYEAMVEEFAWEKTYAEKSAAGPGSTVASPAIRKVRPKRDRTAKFRRWFRDGAVLDVGCGDGSRVPEPMTPYGIELSAQLHAKADAAMRARGGHCVHGPGAEAIETFDADSFDGVLMISYLEHEVAAKRVLTGARRVLKDDGAIFVRVPNYGSLNRRVIGPNWCGFRYPDHVNYFTVASLRDIAARTGFSVEIDNRLSLPVDDNINAVLRPVPERGSA